MKDKLRLVLSLLLVSILILSACGPAAAPPAQTTAAATEAAATTAAATTTVATTTAEPEPVGLPTWLTPEKKTLKFLTHSGYSASSPPPSNDLPVYIECEELTNVRIDFEVILNSEYNNIVNVRLASGSDLPDIMTYNGNIALLSELVEDGILINQEELLKTHYPYLNALINGTHPYADPVYDGILDIMKVNGAFYGATQIVPPRDMQQGLMINKYWMDNLNLSMPETVDELYDVLVAFRDNDANQNGDPNDEIPLVTESYCLPVIANYFDLEYGGSGSGWKAVDGTIQFERIDDKYRSFLRYMNRLYSDKLLDADFLSTNRDACNEYCAENKAGVVNWWIQAMDAFSGHSPYSGDDYNVDEPVFIPIPPLTSEYGGGFIYNRKGGTGSMMTITTACKDPELAALWIDFMFAAPQAMDHVAYGVEGVSYIRNGDKIEKLFDDTGAWKMLAAGGGQQPHAYLESNPEYAYATAAQWKIDAWRSLHPLYKEGTVYMLQLLPEESQKVNDDAYDLMTYVDESRTAFMIGSMDVNDDAVWRTYLETCDKHGLQTYIQIHQQAYDRKYK